MKSTLEAGGLHDVNEPKMCVRRMPVGVFLSLGERTYGKSSVLDFDCDIH